MFVDDYFFDSCLEIPSAPALWVDGIFYTYAELAARALSVSRKLAAAVKNPPATSHHEQILLHSSGCLLFAARSVDAYAGLLGTLHAGFGYIPITPSAPAARNLQVIQGSKSRIALVDKKWEAEWKQLVAAAPAGLLDELLILVLDTDADAQAISTTALRDETTAETTAHGGRDPADLAYVLFTSGSTGTPKGVQISHTSIAGFIGRESKLRPSDPGDRYSGFFELTTDPSVEETFLCWANGACLYTMPKNDPLSVATFLTSHKLTHFSSVPSTIAFLKQYRKLKPGMFPDLKLSIFGGEAFRGDLLRAWAEAAPNAEIRNMYGPTETTVAVAKYAVQAAQVSSAFDGILPIGQPMAGVELVITDESGTPAAVGEPGELLIGGPQVAIGYIGAREEDTLRFVTRTFEGKHATRWYRTGDLVVLQEEPGLPAKPGEEHVLHYRFLGRIDSQVKIRGNRIELQEVESVLADASGATLTAAIALPTDSLGVSPGIVGFIGALMSPDLREGETDLAARNQAILQQCRAKLPAFAVPIKLIQINDFPLNPAGKLDRLALTRQYLQLNANGPASGP